VLALVLAVLALVPLVPHLYIRIVLPLRAAVNPGSRVVVSLLLLRGRVR
jgi:hypothetical protein